MVICNEGKVATFTAVRHGVSATSIVDITMASENLIQCVAEWRVNIEAIQNSDHNSITFKLEKHDKITASKRTSTYLFNNKTAKWPKFHACLQNSIQKSKILSTNFQNCTSIEIDNVFKSLTDSIRSSCSESMKMRKGVKSINPWWNQELQVLKENCIKLHHKLNWLSKNHIPVNAAALVNAEAKRQCKALREASVNNFREFCTNQGKEDVWSITNRIIKDAPLQRPPTTLHKDGRFTETSFETAEALIRHFYPDDNPDVSVKQRAIRSQVKAFISTSND
ncbi:uncharacterized protein LOC118747779 [Rhagoletis pomonella]|uniref:uncharacterized protein LOC118747779 n=1 Tax=Rhagoletis pomonella TaxID=28610 RepID=UPI001783B23E|nr:uncharacterized protein LOC118747779 [Rhagoletis pomonella]